MNALRISLLRVLVGALLGLLPGSVFAASNPLGDERGQFFATVEVPSGLGANVVKDAIIAALAGREWGVKERTDSHVVGYLKHRSNEAKVTLVYTTEKVDIYCVGWAINKKTGERKEPEQPTGWLKRLQGDLTKNLNSALIAK
jgi:hypothetical protein